MNLFSCCLPSEPEDLSREYAKCQVSVERRPQPEVEIIVAHTDKEDATRSSGSNLLHPSSSTGISLPLFLLSIASALLICISVYGFNIMYFSDAPKYLEIADENDHLEIPLENLKITEDQRHLIERIYSSKQLHEKDVVAMAADTGMKISPHMIYRYLESSEWAPTFYGKR
jgi:hypothetical protein